jgi:hypothetical protein
MNINFGLFPPIVSDKKIKKPLRKLAYTSAPRRTSPPGSRSRLARWRLKSPATSGRIR